MFINICCKREKFYCNKTCTTENMKTLVFLSLLFFVNGTEVKENVTKLIENNKNETVKSTVNLLTITQPSMDNFQIKPGINKTEITTSTTTKSPFRASPQLESYIEYNRFPVQKAWPEPKQVKTYQQIQNQNEIRLDKQRYQTKFYPESSTRPPISAPTRPWKVAEDKHSVSTGKPLISDYDSLKFYDKYAYGPSTPFSTPTGPSYDWYSGPSGSYKPIPEHPYPFDTQGPDDHRSEITFPTQKTIVYDEAPVEHVPRKSGWKKVVKFLTAIIPIGLLLTALTPNVLTIGPVSNGTQQ